MLRPISISRLMAGRIASGLFAAALVLALSSSFPAEARAPRGGVSFSVDSTADAVDANPGDGFCASDEGECTLRAAIMEANLADVFPAYINLEPGEYQLELEGAGEDGAATGDLDILVPMNISAEGGFFVAAERVRGFPSIDLPPTVINGLNADRIFHLHPSATTVELTGLTLREGAPPSGEHGAALLVEGGSTSLRVLEILQNQTSGGGLGGGVYAAAGSTVALYATDVYNNSSASGGGVYVASGATGIVEASRLSSNTVTGSGGGIATSGTLLTVTNSTIHANSADLTGGGIYNLAGTTTIVASTIFSNTATNGGNIFTETGTTTSTKSTVVASGAPANCAGAGTYTSLGYNVESANTCNFNQVTDEVNGNVLLGPLADNGGLTWTQILRPTSAAIDQVPEAECLNEDQRGFNRPEPDGASNCDAGAYEAGIAFFRVTVTADGPDATPGDGFCRVFGSDSCTLRAAVQETNALPGDDFILLPDEGPYRLGLLGAGEDLAATGDLDILDDVSVFGAVPFLFFAERNGLGLEDRGIFGDLTPPTTVEANQVDRVFDIHNAQVGLFGLTITEGLAGGTVDSLEPGGGVRNIDGDLSMFLVHLRDNASAVGGGGLYSTGSWQTIYAEIYQNTAGGFGGGGIFTDSSSAGLSASKVWGNSAANKDGSATIGGGIVNVESLEIAYASVSGNDGSSGAGIFNAGTLTAVDSTIWDNEATVSGGGIHNIASATTDFNNVTIADNRVVQLQKGPSLSGGGAFNEDADGFTLSNSILADNEAPSGPDCAGALTSQGFNLVGDTAGCTFVAAAGDETDVDAGLGPVTLFQGFIEGYPLLPESPALDGGNPSIPDSAPDACSSNSLNAQRPVGEACDMGAVEMDQADLSVQIEANPDPVGVGADLLVNLTITNNTNSPSGDGLLTVTFDAEVELADLGSCQPAGKLSVECPLYVSEQSSNSTGIRVRPLVAGTLTIEASAAGGMLSIDPNPKNNSVQVEVTVEEGVTPSATPSSTETATPSATPSLTETATPSTTETPSATPSLTPTTPAGIELFEGWNPVNNWSGAELDGVDEIVDYLNDNIEPAVWESVAWYDTDADQWHQTFVVAPLPSFNTLTQVEPGNDYWLFVTDSALLLLVE